jgi:hypothetical protein
MALKRAKTVEEAREAVEPYMNRVRVAEEPFRGGDTYLSRPLGLYGKARAIARLPECGSAKLGRELINRIPQQARV